VIDALLRRMVRLGDGNAAHGRSLAYVWGFGATCLLATTLLPHPSGANDAGLAVIVAVAYPVAVLLFICATALARVALEAITYLGQLLITALTFFWGAPEAPFLWFHLWLVVHSFHFLAPRRASIQIGVAAVLFVVATVATNAPFPAATSVVGVGSIVAIGLLVGALRARVDALIHALRGVEQLFRTSFENAPIGQALVGLDGRFLRVNRSFGEIVGYAQHELLQRTFQDITHPDDVDADVALLAQLVDGEIDSYELDKRYLHADGRIVWVALHASLVRDEQGIPLHAVAQVRDIGADLAAELERGRYHALVESAEDAIYIVDLEDRILTWNHAAERLYGHTREEIVGRPRSVIVPSERRAELESVRATVLAGGGVQRLETTRVHRDGSIVDVQISMSPVRDDRGAIVGASTIASDISDRLAAEHARDALQRELAHARDQFRSAFEHAPIGVALCVATGPGAGQLVRANRALEELLGCAPGELIGADLASLAHREDRPKLEAAFERMSRGAAERVALEQRLHCGDGRHVWTLVSASLVDIAEDMAAQVVVQFLDISDRKSFEGRLQHLADHDALTGLMNRRRFEAELERTLAHSERYGARGAVLLLDLDGFKDVNDTLGHSVGDELITRVAGVLSGALRTTDVLARLGGDEFAVILPQATEEEALAVADKLLTAVRRRASVTTGRRHARVTTSIGVTLFGPEPGLTGEDLLVEADIAMYDVKDSGRDGVKVFRGHERRRERVMARATWLERLRAGLENGSFRLLAQPITGIVSSGLPWHELLLRFETEDGDLIAPASFLYLAERFDLIADIDRWVLGEAVRILHAEHEAGRDLRLGINMSAKTLGAEGLGEHLAELLSEYPIADGSLVVEVTETAAIVDIDRLRTFSEYLRTLKCKLALDDFGAGFASFYYLKHVRFDYLKIDGEFVRDLVENSIDQLVIEAIVSIAHGIGTETVAEFVGDDATVALLAGLGVDYGQGYHLGRPGPVAELMPGRRS